MILLHFFNDCPKQGFFSMYIHVLDLKVLNTKSVTFIVQLFTMFLCYVVTVYHIIVPKDFKCTEGPQVITNIVLSLLLATLYC